ncbi:MAG: ComEC/Rec2 family competence protein, partial [Bryobacteraceae bacterium]
MPDEPNSSRRRAAIAAALGFMPREPLILPCTALACGIFVAHFVYFTPADLLIPGAICGAAAVLAFALSNTQRARLAVACTACALFGISMQVVHRDVRTPRLNVGDGEVALLSGCVVRPPDLSPDRERFTLELARGASALVSVFLKPGEKLRLAYGERIELPAKIRLPRNYQDPGEFDYAGYLAAQHIYWTASTSSYGETRILPGRCGSRALSSVFAIRTWALDRLRTLYPGDPHTTALLSATLLGETSGVERRWTNDFRVTGTYHALVISGLHISIVAMALLVLMRILWIPRIAALWTAVGVCWLYSLLAGFHAPAVRASAGFMLFVVAATLFRRARTLNLLAFIGIVYLTLDPDQLFDASFQLSFLSVALIAVFARPAMERYTVPLRTAVRRFEQRGYDPQIPPRAAQWRVELRLLAETIARWTRLPETAARRLLFCFVVLATFAADMAILSACIQFGLALPMIAYFHRLSITGISANTVIVPLLSLVVPLGFAAIATGSHLLAWITKLLLQWAEIVAAWHVRFEPAWRIASLPLWIAIAFAVSLLVLAIAIRRRRRWTIPALAGSLALFAVICLQPWKPETHPGMLEVTAIDVSQGDSLFLAFPDGETMLVDAGGFPGMGRMTHKPKLDVGEDVVSPYLWSRRIHHLDYVVLTHGHSDHMGGLPAVLDNFRPNALWISVEPETTEWRNVQAHAAADRVSIVAMNRATPPFTLGGTRIRVLAPAVDYVPGAAAQNDDSLVLEITYGHRRVLLTGDAERPI